MLAHGAVTVRLPDLLEDRPQPKPETRSTQEIANGIIDGLAAILEGGSQ